MQQLLRYCDDDVVIPMSDSEWNCKQALLSLNKEEQIALFLIMWMNCFTRAAVTEGAVGSI